MPLPPVIETYFEDVEVGMKIPTISIGPLTMVDFVMVPSAHHIWYIGHFDEEYAKAQGMPDMFMHGFFYYGLMQRLLCNWGGASAIPRRIKYKLARPTVRGHLITGSGVVTSKRVENGEHLVELDIKLNTQHGETNCIADATLVLASRENSGDPVEPPQPKSLEVGIAITADGYKQYIGRETGVRNAPWPVTERAIKHYLESIQDSNPLYWSEEYGEQTKWGGRIAPWGGSNVLVGDHGAGIPNWWKPEWMDTEKQISLNVLDGIPGFPSDQQANTGTEYWCYEPVKIGDRLSMTVRLASIVGPKTTKVGTGYFVTTEGIWTNQDGKVCMKDDMTVFNYKRGDAAGYTPRGG